MYGLKLIEGVAVQTWWLFAERAQALCVKAIAAAAAMRPEGATEAGGGCSIAICVDAYLVHPRVDNIGACARTQSFLVSECARLSVCM